MWCCRSVMRFQIIHSYLYMHCYDDTIQIRLGFWKCWIATFLHLVASLHVAAPCVCLSRYRENRTEWFNKKEDAADDLETYNNTILFPCVRFLKSQDAEGGRRDTFNGIRLTECRRRATEDGTLDTGDGRADDGTRETEGWRRNVGYWIRTTQSVNW